MYTPPYTPMPPLRCFWRCFFDSEKMTLLEMFDMYLIVLGILSQYFIIFSEYLVAYLVPGTRYLGIWEASRPIYWGGLGGRMPPQELS